MKKGITTPGVELINFEIFYTKYLGALFSAVSRTYESRVNLNRELMSTGGRLP
jgi:hypothetical protein